MILSGCDAMRKLAGRPTSEELKALKAIKLAEAEMARKISEEVKDTVVVIQTPAVPSARVGRYRVVLGVFRDASNASNLVSKARKAGFDAVVQTTSSGASIVYVEAGDSKSEAENVLKRVKAQPFCPSDASISEKKK